MDEMIQHRRLVALPGLIGQRCLESVRPKGPQGDAKYHQETAVAHPVHRQVDGSLDGLKSSACGEGLGVPARIGSTISSAAEPGIHTSLHASHPALARMGMVACGSTVALNAAVVDNTTAS